MRKRTLATLATFGTLGLAASLALAPSGALAQHPRPLPDDDRGFHHRHHRGDDGRSDHSGSRNGGRENRGENGTEDTELQEQLRAARAATAEYRDVAAAEADGYELATECVPEMGYHYVKSVAENEDELEITEPNALVYDPEPDGLRLGALEYISEEPATLFGQEFDPPSEEVPYYTLHVWIWKYNPDGIFDPTNPLVSCDDEEEDAEDADGDEDEEARQGRGGRDGRGARGARDDDEQD